MSPNDIRHWGKALFLHAQIRRLTMVGVSARGFSYELLVVLLHEDDHSL